VVIVRGVPQANFFHKSCGGNSLSKIERSVPQAKHFDDFHENLLERVSLSKGGKVLSSRQIKLLGKMCDTGKNIGLAELTNSAAPVYGIRGHLLLNCSI